MVNRCRKGVFVSTMVVLGVPGFFFLFLDPTSPVEATKKSHDPILPKFTCTTAAEPVLHLFNPVEELAAYGISRVRGYFPLALGSAPAAAKCLTQTCTSEITGTNPHCPVTADQVWKGEYDTRCIGTTDSHPLLCVVCPPRPLFSPFSPHETSPSPAQHGALVFQTSQF